MTSEHTDIITGGKPTKDPNALKIASFRTKEGVWGEFCQKAESMGMTATDVIKAAMAEFIDGSYNPVGIHTAVSTDNVHHDNALTRNDILEIVSTVISTEQINSHIMTAIGTLSIHTASDVNTAIHTAINLLRAETNSSLAELETFTRSQLEAMRDELKKPLAIAR